MCVCVCFSLFLGFSVQGSGLWALRSTVYGPEGLHRVRLKGLEGGIVVGSRVLILRI